ncbi:hypothetical protein [Cohnella lupini]|uniref:hypothetical protein n=1 Tax=Cohnella lupini TaxID=1294267 RepID=UPI001C6DF56F|nr:hypothetical protein [Cohnella lupini]
MKRSDKKTPDAVMVEGVDLSKKADQTVMIWKATRPLTDREHEQLSDRLRYESEKTGINIVLVPFSVEVGVSAE